MAQDRVSRHRVNNLPFFSESDRIREKRSIQKYKFEEAETKRRSKIQPTTSLLEQGAIPVDFKWAEVTLREIHNKKQGVYNTYTNDQKTLLISAIQAHRFIAPSHTWITVAGIIGTQLKAKITSTTASGWIKNEPPLIPSTSERDISISNINRKNTIETNAILELRKYAVSTYLYYRTLKFTAEISTKLVNSLYGTNVTGKYLMTIDPETGETKESRPKEDPMMTTDEQIAPLNYTYTPPVAEQSSDITDSQITKLATEIIQRSVDVMNENTQLKERIKILETEKDALRSNIHDEFNEIFANDHEKFTTVIDQQKATINKQAEIIEDLKKQVTQKTSVNNEGQRLVNMVKDFMGGNKKEN